ncbi:nitrous oxide reductase accessory protein NosL [Ferrimonas senticii]|uniref:nitrous oxide reductase accessory protein NosL n=1 Tax=Ferrimonas senticii TaxID=394566 RepID=UPI000400010C|nr:nitrous oxide reductase accessory protein NosL [Ferrimonas senticii]
MISRRDLLKSATAFTLLMSCPWAQAIAKLAHPENYRLHENHRCHQCGMMVTKYPGPKGMITLKNNQPAMAFCSSRDMFMFALQPQNARQIAEMVVHDMGRTDWQTPSDEFFIDAKSATFVYGTSAKGVMGPAVPGFSTPELAQAHIDKFGGKIYRFDEITMALLNSNAPKMKHHKHQ